MELVPADSLDLDALTELFNAVYSDYTVPLRLDRTGLEFTIEVSDVDLATSRVAMEDGEPVAFALLALRGDEAWIGGMGTVPAHRRRGLGEAVLASVLEQARERTVRTVRLEVIDRNTGAVHLYEKLGFESVRDLGVWVLESAPPRITRARPADAAEAQSWIAANRLWPEPWQRADETLEHMRARGLEFEGLVVEPDGGDGEIAGALLYQHGTGLPRIVQIAARGEKAAAHLLAAVAARGDGFRFVNLPADEPAARAVERLGARLEVRQHEMRLSL